MLGASSIIGFAPTTDFERARDFFDKTLGLRFVSNDGFALVLESATP